MTKWHNFANSTWQTAAIMKIFGYIWTIYFLINAKFRTKEHNYTQTQITWSKYSGSRYLNRDNKTANYHFARTHDKTKVNDLTSASEIVGYSTWVRWVVSTNIIQFNEFEYHFACRRNVVHLCFIMSPGKMIFAVLEPWLSPLQWVLNW